MLNWSLYRSVLTTLFFRICSFLRGDFAEIIFTTWVIFELLFLTFSHSFVFMMKGEIIYI